MKSYNLFCTTSFWCLLVLVVPSVTAQLYGHGVDFKQVEEIVPVEAKQFYESLTGEDKQVLQKVLSKSTSYTSVREVLADLRNGSTTLYDKTVGIVGQMRQTIASLSPSARAFVDETARQLNDALSSGFSIAQLKSEANEIVNRFRSLDAKAQKELKDAFPMVTTVVYNNVFQTLAVGLLGIDGGPPQPQVTAAPAEVEEPEHVQKKIVV
uniref:Uncharacterized protein n=1 Tax=Ditylenchus dipsaci TaxID=166011 RepID=A0A915CTT8_9BILA